MDRNAEFTEYAAARWGALVRALVLLGCPARDAEDVAQSALERCLLHWDRVRRAHDRDAYVHRVLVNTWRSSHRPRWTRERPVAGVPEDRARDWETAVDDATAVRRMLARLAPGQREVVVLRFYADLTEQQVAAALGVPVGTVKSRLSRALSVLARDPDLDDLRRPS